MPYKTIEEKRAAWNRWYHSKGQASSLVNTKVQKEKAKNIIRRLKEDNPCTDCGRHYPYYVMDYDHVGDDKIGDVGNLVVTRGIKAALAEIEKCDLVCANCHRIRTHHRAEVRILAPELVINDGLFS